MNQQNINTVQDILDALDANPELQRALNKHLVRAIQTDDELRQDLRKEILTEELLQMPARFLRLEQAVENLLQDMVEVKQDVAELKQDMVEVKQDVAELKQDMVEVKQDVAELKQDMVEVKQDVAELKQDMVEVKQDVAELKQDMVEVKDQQTRMSGQIANLAGSDYESKAIERSRRLIRRNLAMVKATVIHASRWESQTVEENMLLPAIADGSISRQQADQLEDADSIIRCEDQDGNIVHAVAEISITVQDQDRRRAAECAEILAAITGTPAVPFVVGQEEEPPGAGVPNVSFLAYHG